MRPAPFATDGIPSLNWSPTAAAGRSRRRKNCRLRGEPKLPERCGISVRMPRFGRAFRRRIPMGILIPRPALRPTGRSLPARLRAASSRVVPCRSLPHVGISRCRLVQPWRRWRSPPIPFSPIPSLRRIPCGRVLFWPPLGGWPPVSNLVNFTPQPATSGWLGNARAPMSKRWEQHAG